jgi:hypothetical protein
MSAVITTDDVMSNMVVAGVSQAAGLPPDSATIAAWYSVVTIGLVVVARAWSGDSMRRRYLQHRRSMTASSADEMAATQGLEEPGGHGVELDQQ